MGFGLLAVTVLAYSLLEYTLKKGSQNGGTPVGLWAWLSVAGVAVTSPGE